MGDPAGRPTGASDADLIKVSLDLIAQTFLLTDVIALKRRTTKLTSLPSARMLRMLRMQSGRWRSKQVSGRVRRLRRIRNVSWHLAALSYELFMRMLDGSVNSVPDFRELQLVRVIGAIHVRAAGPN